MVENRPPTSVSDAQESADKDYEQRVRRYTISMIIRVVCLLLAFVVSGPLRWVMLGGAVVLPYIAVVIANSRNERLVHYEMTGVDGPPQPVLPAEATPSPESTDRQPDAPDVPDASEELLIVGEVLADTLDRDTPEAARMTDNEEDEDDS
ncbi:DUF3099 domain-containing protein [Brevibacterium jeotgali]|uniref:DUF3099 domain-containing protein n=1 Tax=Brevibacterium jeotgali TaxID=1262550 RepID=A0A2H1L2F9_9MICO|nr:DUF3099 domain-containing protein [Brevibacterium jeotgali]TWC02883.1 DUF3099 family protein [Brevibacterium jeotgali]SMY10905.1 Protein of unknown function (DUF3099) [Brevibacterium jeotgali]